MPPTLGLWIAWSAAGTGVVVAALCWRFARSYRFNLLQLVLYFLQWPLTRVLWRTKVTGRWPLPREAGAVCVVNHTSSVDPFPVQRFLPKLARWMVAKEFFVGIAGWFLRRALAIEVSRSGIDTAATKTAIRHAQAGGIVGIFPEGRINRGGETLLPGRPGAALVALKAGVPIVPCHVQGIPYGGTILSSFRPARVRVSFGAPIYLDEYAGRDDKDALAEVTLRCLREMAALAGDPGFEVRLAGKHWKTGAEENGHFGEDEPPSAGEGPAPPQAPHGAKDRELAD